MADGLFNDPPDVSITAYDIFGRPHERSLKNFRFRVSVYGLLRRNDEILVNRHPLQSQYGLPGGGVEIGESMTAALIREFREETGLEIRPIRLLGVRESFFTFGGQDAHGILILYATLFGGGSDHTRFTRIRRRCSGRSVLSVESCFEVVFIVEHVVLSFPILGGVVGDEEPPRLDVEVNRVDDG